MMNNNHLIDVITTQVLANASDKVMDKILDDMGISRDEELGALMDVTERPDRFEQQ